MPSLKTIKQQFGRRLRQEMIDQGYNAIRAASGADASILASKTGVTLEMARRYILGTSMPIQPEIIAAICKWLNVRESWLMRGELPKQPQESEPVTGIDQELFDACLDSILDSIEASGHNLSQSAIAKATARLYNEYLTTEKKKTPRQLQKLIGQFDQNK